MLWFLHHMEIIAYLDNFLWTESDRPCRYLCQLRPKSLQAGIFSIDLILSVFISVSCPVQRHHFLNQLHTALRSAVQIIIR